VPRPRDALVASTANLPPPLRHLRKDAPKTLAAAARPPLRIAFPPDGARVDLGLTGPGSGERAALALKITGGAPPFTWLVDGRPVEAGTLRREGAWAPDGAGFVRVSVIDGRGESDSVTVRLE
jgi:penicillin-binding protein 1C